jgi:tRNA threonylcarbamoyladenosine biosynthesis protein TsaB
MFLCIDTATEDAGVALVDEHVTHGYLPLDRMKASEEILANIDQLIKNSGGSLDELRAVFVIKGPGSFTGLRVGIAVANQFAHQLNIPIVGVRTEEFYRHRHDVDDFVYLQSMNRDESYVIGFGSFFNFSDEKIVSIPQLEKNPPSVWCGQLNVDHSTLLLKGELQKLETPEHAWCRLAFEFNRDTEREKYDLVEPYYGKEPNITKSKKKPLFN